MDRLQTWVGHIMIAPGTRPPSLASSPVTTRSETVAWIEPDVNIVQAFAEDEAWAGKRFWMLNVLKFKDGAGKDTYDEYERQMQAELKNVGAKFVLSGDARTVIGRRDFDRVIIVDYPSPEVFVRLMTSASAQPKFQIRKEGLAYQYLVPLRPGWFHLDEAAPTPVRAPERFTTETAWTTPNGMVGAAVSRARVGETSANQCQAGAFVQDARFDGKLLWHLNLLKFKGSDGKASYNRYAMAMGTKQGVLGQVGARSTMSTSCYRSLLGEFDFDRAIIAEYPSRDAFLSMGASEEYLKVANFRHEGLAEAYVISMIPETVVE